VTVASTGTARVSSRSVNVTSSRCEELDLEHERRARLDERRRAAVAVGDVRTGR
jgi:hypothetical protein